MLEGLCKLYAGMHNKKKFFKLKERFKLVEDVLGAIDYYDSFAIEFAANKKIPPSITTYLVAQTREKIQHLNEILLEEGWIKNKNKRIGKIREKLEGADWMNDAKEIKAIAKFYHLQVETINTFFHTTEHHFDNVESDVHEMRRKLRWLSIYPQALGGAIQLASNKKTHKHLQKYLVPEIVNSPFNKMPDVGSNRQVLLLDKNLFLALSWLISELGKIKDNGLRIIAIKEALQQGSALNEADALKQATSYFLNKGISLPGLLKKAEHTCMLFFKERILDALILGPSSLPA
jgi:hypothetical protein